VLEDGKPGGVAEGLKEDELRLRCHDLNISNYLYVLQIASSSLGFPIKRKEKGCLLVGGSLGKWNRGGTFKKNPRTFVVKESEMN
jgi:hypothetical protein